MEAKHTPGPWHFVPSAYQGPTIDEQPGAFMVVDSEDSDSANTLCTRFAWKEKAEEMHANGRLMAAAPELLDALDAALRAMNNECDPDEYAGSFAKIRTAITKATGSAA